MFKLTRLSPSRRSMFVLMAFVFILLLIPDTTNYAQTNTGSISGIIHYRDASVPVPIVLNNVIVLAFGDGFALETCTDVNGRYSIPRIPFDEPFRVKAGGTNDRCDGPFFYSEEFWQETENVNDAIVLEATTSLPDLDGVDFTLDYYYSENHPPDGTISGQVLDQVTGEPILHTSVAAYDENLSLWLEDCTDGNGRYTIYGVPIDVPLWVVASDDGTSCDQNENYIREYWDGTYQSIEASLITIRANNLDISDINFMLEQGGSVTGQLFDEDYGHPIDNIPLIAFGEGFAVDACAGGVGIYTITDIPFNTPFRLVAASGFRYPDGSEACEFAHDYQMEYWDDTSDLESATWLVVTEDNPELTLSDFRLQHVDQGTVSGHIYDESTGQPLRDMTVVAFDENFWLIDCTDVGGAYEIRDIPFNASFRILASDDGNSCNGGDNYVQEYWDNTFDYNEATLFMLNEQTRSITGIDFNLEAGGSISGHVFNPIDGLPIPNVKIVASGEGFGIDMCTDLNGDYTITGIPYGIPFRVIAANGTDGCGQNDYYAREFWEDSYIDWEGFVTILTLDENLPEINGVDFGLLPAGTVSGQVIDQDSSQPLGNMNIFAFADDFMIDTCTDFNGNYTIPDIPLDMPVRLIAGDRDWVCGGDDNYRQEFWQEAIDFETATTITLTTGVPDVDSINFTLRRDIDTDGIVDAVEDNAPNNGDGNSDGIPDSQQSNVTSLPDAVNGEYVTLAVPDGLTLFNVHTLPAEDLLDDLELPIGLIQFQIFDLNPGDSVSAVLYVPDADSYDTYYKYGVTPDNPEPHWYEFTYDGTTGAEFVDGQIILHFVDGQRGDDDLTANGIIRDPGGPANIVSVPPENDGPDADGDGFVDDEDACPWQGDEGGLGTDETGCPYYDADWDGIYDRDDACPWQGNEGGGDLGIDETGCPYYDADGDGVIDRDDACPWRADEYGLGIDETGCPVPENSTEEPEATENPDPYETEEWSDEYRDADWDGFPDEYDACPSQGNEGGLGVDETGCPYYDADWDGVYDRDDECPWRGNEYGLGIDDTGCPVEANWDDNGYATEEPGVTEEPAQ